MLTTTFVCLQVQPFLVLYQTDRPMMPFISTDLYNLLHSLMGKFLKPEILEKEGSTLAGLVKIGLGTENQMPLEKLKIGYVTRKELVKTTIIDRQRLEFRGDCRDFLVAVLKKLLQKSPATYPLVRHLSLLDPGLMAQKENKETLETKLTRVLDIMTKANRVKNEICDSVLSQFRQFLDLACSVHRSEMLDFNHEEESHRLDVLLHRLIGAEKKFAELWSVVRQLVILSHGQATVERGFSINKEASTDNLSEKAMVAKRQIINYVRRVGGIQNVTVGKELLLAASSARSKYHLYLEQTREKESAAKAGEKRKQMEQEVSEMKKKKRRFEKDIEDLIQESDKLAKEGEAKHEWRFITQSLALKDKAQSKREELDKLTKTIEQKEVESGKNC